MSNRAQTVGAGGQRGRVPTRILIADDQRPVRSALKALLEAHPDWQVCGEAATGLEAVQRTAELNPDLIILDVGMPKMDGLQAAREISSASPDVPIVIYTNYVFPPEAKLDAAKLGVRQVITKGAPGAQLVTAVETVLSQRPRVQPDAALAAPSIPQLGPQGGPEEA